MNTASSVKGRNYNQLTDSWRTYYKVAHRYSHKAKVADTDDLLHDIMITLARAERSHTEPLTEATMSKIASRAVAEYWRAYYTVTRGLTCHRCPKGQREACKRDWNRQNCPKAIKLEHLEKPIIDGEGNHTELGDMIADDRFDADANVWELGYPKRLVEIAYKLDRREALSVSERKYLSRFRKSAKSPL